MQVNDTSIGATTTPSKAATTSVTGASALDYNAFLRLLMAQMQDQDPTSPTDSTQWVSQLATFSSVEQSIQANAKLDQILTGAAIADAGALVGKTVVSSDGQTSGKVAAVSVTSSGFVAQLADGATLDLSTGVTVLADE